MRAYRAIILAALLSALAACSPGGLRTGDGSPFAPGVDATRAADDVDGLIVGHRLMEAGEFELALEAYNRAAVTQGMTIDVVSAMGSANLRLGRLGQAERLLRRAIEMDETFVPAWNNLGVVLMEQGNYPEASRVFTTAFALDSGETADIRDNLALALAKIENPNYSEDDKTGPALVRRGSGEFLLLSGT